MNQLVTSSTNHLRFTYNAAISYLLHFDQHEKKQVMTDELFTVKSHTEITRRTMGLRVIAK